jgi:hypothetical protein
LAEIISIGIRQKLPEFLTNLIDDHLYDVHGSFLHEVLHLQGSLVGLHVGDDLALERVVGQFFFSTAGIRATICALFEEEVFLLLSVELLRLGAHLTA